MSIDVSSNCSKSNTAAPKLWYQTPEWEQMMEDTEQDIEEWAKAFWEMLSIRMAGGECEISISGGPGHLHITVKKKHIPNSESQIEKSTQPSDSMSFSPLSC